MPLPLKYQVNVVIAKLPPSWKDYKLKLMHKREDLPMEVLKHHLHVKKIYRFKRKNDDQSVKVHLIKNKFDDKKALKKKWFKPKTKDGNKPFKKEKIKFTCYKCEKPGHMARNYRSKKINSTSSKKGK